MKKFLRNWSFIRTTFQASSGKSFALFVCCVVFWLLGFTGVGLLMVWVPAEVLRLLEQGQSFFQILLPVLILGLAQVLLTVLEYPTDYLPMAYRTQEIARASTFLMTLPAEKMNAQEGQALIDKAMYALYQGNEQGLEGFMRDTLAILRSLALILTFLLVSAALPWYWLLALVLPSIARGLASIQVNRYIQAQRPLEIELYRDREYLEKIALKTEAAKDQRLYDFPSLLREKAQVALKRSRKVTVSKRKRMFAQDSVGLVLSLVRNGLVAWYLAGQVLAGQADLSAFVLQMGIVFQIGQYVDQFFTSLADLANHSQETAAYVDLWDEPTYTEGDYPCHIPEGPLDLVFEDVSYAYDGGTEVLHNVSFQLQPGEKLALVGENGAGKTTLVKLAAGLLTPTQGRILANGVDLALVNPKERFDRVTMIFQEVLLFAFNLEENLSLQAPDQVDKARLQKALEDADVQDLVQSLPKGLATPVTQYIDPEGMDFSGGQKQRLMLARGLYKGGDLIILDEPTAALDPLAEAALYQEYLAFTRDKTSIFISHRLSSTQFCDRILYLQDGCLVQEGSHEDLLAQDGPYRDMFETQASYYREQEAHPDSVPADQAGSAGAGEGSGAGGQGDARSQSEEGGQVYA